MMRSCVFALVLAVTGCSAGNGTPQTGAAANVARALAYRGLAVVTGTGDLAACPQQSDLDQYRNDMRNIRLDPGDPGYAVARDYDLRNRRCIELKSGQRVDIEGDNGNTESLVRPFGQSQTYWTTAKWTSAEAIGARR